MSGLFLAFIALIWLWLLAKLVRLFTSGIKDLGHRLVVALISYCVLLPLPLIDELLGKRQFERLCEENSRVQVDRISAAASSVYLAETTDVEIKGILVRIVMRPTRYIDVSNGDVVLSYNELRAGGGRLIRLLGLIEGGGPLMFKGSCFPSELAEPDLFKKLRLTQIQRSDLPPLEKK